MTKPFAASLAVFLTLAGEAYAACVEQTKGEAQYVICEFDVEKDDIRLFLNDERGAPYGDFGPLAKGLEAKGERLVFAMNAGMYHDDRSPVGLYVEEGREIASLSRIDGPGNFHLKPNGVFWIAADGAAHVAGTEDFAATAFDSSVCEREARGKGDSPLPLGEGSGVRVTNSKDSTNLSDGTLSPDPSPTGGGEQTRACVPYATQSGPMLVIDGKIHPRFLVDATSRKRRNGVGVKEDGTVVFVLADAPVTFHEFATFFRDELKTPNALYLDGTISRLYAPDLSRNDPGVMMGPIVAVVAKSE